MRFLSSWSTEAAGSTYSKARYYILSSAFERKGDQQQTDFVFCPRWASPLQRSGPNGPPPCTCRPRTTRPRPTRPCGPSRCARGRAPHPWLAPATTRCPTWRGWCTSRGAPAPGPTSPIQGMRRSGSPTHEVSTRFLFNFSNMIFF